MSAPEYRKVPVEGGGYRLFFGEEQLGGTHPNLETADGWIRSHKVNLEIAVSNGNVARLKEEAKWERPIAFTATAPVLFPTDEALPPALANVVHEIARVV